jgi:hypothetical protein
MKTIIKVLQVLILTTLVSCVCESPQGNVIVRAGGSNVRGDYYRIDGEYVILKSGSKEYIIPREKIQSITVR